MNDDPTPDGLPREQYSRKYLVAPQDASMEEWLAICRQAYKFKQTVGFSFDDAGIGALDRKAAFLYDIPSGKRSEYMAWFEKHYPQTNITFRDTPG